ncbi:MAG: threonine synthase [Anaerolineae bacterium]|nr:threonine synthase [Anaerolineae bacterium]
MSAISNFRCVICHREYGPDEVQYTCVDCGDVGTLDVLYDYEVLRANLDRDRLVAIRDYTMWRYRELLPIGENAVVPPLSVGMTPLYDAPRLAAEMGLAQVWVKDDGRNPTGSLKDRASALVVARAMEAGIKTVSTASTGNAAAALAGVSASVGMIPVIFVPASAPEAKIAQLLVYGARVILIEGTYDQAFDLCYEVCQQKGWYCRNTGINPFTAEGKKTAAFELAEQLGWEMPDVVVVSVGDGNIIAGVHKGLTDLLQLGWISRIPRLVGVQAVGSSPLAAAWKAGINAQDMLPVDAETIADSISAGLPRDRAKALRAVRQTGGAFIAVSDDQILQAIPILAQLTGVFAEPAAAAAFAGAKLAVQQGLIQQAERTALLLTGNGLKDVRRAQQAVGKPVRAAPEIGAVLRSLSE